MNRKLSGFLDGMFSFVGSFNPDCNIITDPNKIYHQASLIMKEPWKLIGQAMNDTIKRYGTGNNKPYQI